MSSKALSMDEFRGLSAIAKARKENLTTLLAGTHLEWGKWAREQNTAALVKCAGKVGYATRKFIKALGSTTVEHTSPTQAVQAGKELFTIASGIHDYSDVVAAVTSEAAHTAIGEITPFLGLLTSAYGSVKSWRAVFQGGYSLYKDSQAKLDVLPGDPRAAAEAIITLLERKLANDAVSAARNTVSLGAKIGGLFADFGTATTAAIGVANAAAALAQQLAMLGLDYSDMKAGNARLADPGNLSLTVFEECPILGCYIIVCSDTSNILNFFVADIGLPGWMDKIEDMKKHSLDRLIKDANKFIVNSRLHLANAPTNKGIAVPKTFAQKVKTAFSNLVKTKTPGL